MSRSLVHPVHANKDGRTEQQKSEVDAGGYSKKLLTSMETNSRRFSVQSVSSPHGRPRGSSGFAAVGSSQSRRESAPNDEELMVELSRLNEENATILNLYISMNPLTLHFNNDVLEHEFKHYYQAKRHSSIMVAYLFQVLNGQWDSIAHWTSYADGKPLQIGSRRKLIVEQVVTAVSLLMLGVGVLSKIAKTRLGPYHDLVLCACVLATAISHVAEESELHEDVVNTAFLSATAYITVVISRMPYLKASCLLASVHAAFWVVHTDILSVESMSMILCSVSFGYSLRASEIGYRRDFRLTKRLAAENIDVKIDVTTRGWFDKGQAKVSPANLSSTAKTDTFEDNPTNMVSSHLIRHADLELGETLGRGAFGTVMAAKWHGTNVAVKRVHGAATQKLIEDFGTESAIMASVRHPAIVMHLGVCLKPLMMVMELMPRGSLYTIIHVSKMTLDWSLRFRMILDTACGMTFLHNLEDPILHNDLKSLNILVDKNWRCKVSDFGFSKMLHRVQESKRGHRSELSHSGELDAKRGEDGSRPAGMAAETSASGSQRDAAGENFASTETEGGGAVATVGWASPEMLLGEPLTEKNDVYAFGVVLFELLTLALPFEDMAREAIPLAVLDGTRPADLVEMPVSADGSTNLPEHQVAAIIQLQELMCDCWNHDAEARPFFPEVLQRIEAAREWFFGKECKDWDEEVVIPARARDAAIVSSLSSSDASDFTIDPDDLQMGPKIGSGAYGEVHEAIYHGTHVAVKKLFNAGISPSVMQEFQKECKLMLSFRHPNVVLFLGANHRPPNLLLVTELLTRGSLYFTYNSRPMPTERKRHLELIQRISEGMALGLNYLHKRNPPVIHRDMKSPNVLLDDNWNAKISDFGLSRIKEEGKIMTCVGSPLWAAPETLRGDLSGCPSDVYSFAIVLWELVAWTEPYPNMAPAKIMREVALKGLRPVIPPHCPDLVRDLLTKCWESDPDKRPTFDEIIPQVESWATQLK